MYTVSSIGLPLQADLDACLFNFALTTIFVPYFYVWFVTSCLSLVLFSITIIGGFQWQPPSQMQELAI